MMHNLKSLSNDEICLSNDANDAQSEKEQQDLKQGVYECIEFLKYHATNDVLLISREKRQLKMFGSCKR